MTSRAFFLAFAAAVLLAASTAPAAPPSKGAAKPPGARKAAGKAGAPTSAAEPSATPTTAPTGTLEVSETVFDGGSVERGTAVQHAFVVKNVGKGDLTVDARPGCGCTVVDFDKVIPPGGTGKVTASVNTEHFKGPITKGVTITTNDPANTTVMLQLKADVKVALEVMPMDTVYLQGKVGSIRPGHVTVSSTNGEPFDILSVSGGDPAFKLSVEPSKQPRAEGAAPAAKTPSKPAKAAGGAAPLGTGSSSYDVTVSATNKLTVGRGFTTITLNTSHPKGPTVDVRVSTYVQGDVTVTPERLYFAVNPDAPAGAGTTQHAKVSKPTGTPLRIERVESSDPDFKTSVKAVAEGREYDVEVKYVGKAGRGPVSTQLTIKTNDARQASIVVPVLGQV